MNNKYLPKQLRSHPDFIEYQDVIAVFFDEDQFYTMDEAKALIQKILHKEVD